MTSPTLELQKAIYDRLKGDVPLADLIAGRVFDAVPPETVFPYISFGPSDETSDDADCIDGFEVTFQIDVWSRMVGFVEARRVADAVRAALKPDMTLPDNALVSFNHRITRTFRDSDGKTSHAVLTFEAFIEQPS